MSPLIILIYRRLAGRYNITGGVGRKNKKKKTQENQINPCVIIRSSCPYPRRGTVSHFLISKSVVDVENRHTAPSSPVSRGRRSLRPVDDSLLTDRFTVCEKKNNDNKKLLKNILTSRVRGAHCATR